MITKNQMNKIKRYALHMDWEVAFKGKSKGNRHLFRVNKLILELARKEKARIDICEAGGWLHDIGLSRNTISKSYKGLDLTEAFLKKLKVSKEDINHILECVKCHDGYYKAKTVEAKIVHDADTLDKTGSLGVIREAWKKSQTGWNSEKIGRSLKCHLLKRQNMLYTKSSKHLSKMRNKKLNSFFKLLKEQLK